ncbi:MAG: restriction endonuclease subunit S, partial [Candidatus Heimdallarchaeaceae archaeon]
FYLLRYQMFSNKLPTKNLSELIVVVKRGLSSYYIQEEGVEVPFISISNIEDGKVDSSSVERVYVKETEALHKSRVEPNDVIITIKGNTFKAAVVDNEVKDYVISANLIAFKLKEIIIPEIVVAYLNSPKGQRELQARAAGALQKALNLKSLMSMEIPIPRKEQQKMLAEYFRLSKQHDDLLKKERMLRKKLNNSLIQHTMG